MRFKEPWERRRGPILFGIFVLAVAGASVYVVASAGSDDEPAIAEPVSATAGADAGADDPQAGDPADGQGGERGDSAEDEPAEQGQPPPGATQAADEPAEPEQIGKQPPPGATAPPSAAGSDSTEASDLGSQPPQENPDHTGKPTQFPPDEPDRPGDDKPSPDGGVEDAPVQCDVGEKPGRDC